MKTQSINFENAALGIEFGSTRIKAVLADERHNVLAGSSYEWENRLIGGLWTYSLDEVAKGMRECYISLKREVLKKYGAVLKKVGAIGISGMMHGYLVFDKNGGLLTPFRTWRNNSAESAAAELTKLFNYNIPARWSIAHLYQAVKNNEAHVADIAFQTTLAGYIHCLLTGQRVIGIGEASGMFPIDLSTKQYNQHMVDVFESLPGVKKAGIRLKNIFPEILLAGDGAGALTEEGARLLDAEGDLQAGIPFCPPEGDAGTGMVATNSVRRRTGNISAGTSIFAMIVLEKELSKVYPEIDLVTTPSGELVAMAHCNNGASDINAWADIFSEVTALAGIKKDRNALFDGLFKKSLEGDKDCGGVLVYNYVSGEHITGVEQGRPMVLRCADSRFNLANLMRAQLYSVTASLKIGLDILFDNEKTALDSVFAHGGLFKTEGVCQRYLSAAINAPVTVTENSGEGGAWGMAVLAAYMLDKKALKLEDYLDKNVFAGKNSKTVMAGKDNIEGMNAYMERFKAGLAVEKEAVKAVK